MKDYVLLAAIREFINAMDRAVQGTEIQELSGIIRNFALTSALAALLGAIPGVGALVSILTQTGLVWTMYVKINNVLGISIKENTLKFIGSAIITNMMANAGTMIVSYLAAGLLSFIPIFGQYTTPVLLAGLGYTLIYAAAILYFNLLTKVMKAEGKLDLSESDSTEQIIKDVINNAKIEDIIKEGRNNFEHLRKSGELDAAKKSPKCPECGKGCDITKNFCSECGFNLKK